MTKQEDKKQHQIKIELDDNIGQGEYSNFAVVTHSPAEFIMDYIRVLPGMTKSKVKSRIIMAPMHAKTLMMALQDNIKKYLEDNASLDTIKEVAKGDLDKAQKVWQELYQPFCYQAQSYRHHFD